MALVTVCVPSYRSARFINQTLASISAQTFTDYEVVLGLEPDGAAETIAAADRFLADPRTGYRVNTDRLGWAANVRALLERVDTPYFAILPHDDLWHPRFLAAQLERLERRRDAAGAYVDLWTFGASSGVIRIDIADGPLPERVLSWLAGNANGFAWSGLTRRECLDRPFPTNGYDSFLVECEWVLHVLQRGPLLHVPEALYIKRQPQNDDSNVSMSWRVRTSPDTLRAALDHHRRQMLEQLGLNDPAAGANLVELAAEAALLRHFVIFNHARFDFSPAEEQRVEALSAALAADFRPVARTILGRLHGSLARYHGQRGRRGAAMRHAQAAVAAAPDLGEAHIALATHLLANGQAMQAVPVLQRASELAPLWLGLAALARDAARQLEGRSTTITLAAA